MANRHTIRNTGGPMLKLLEECIDELCLKCGRYENQHEGSCDHCKWFATKNGDRKKKYDQVLLDCADDIKYHCENSCCQTHAHDEYGDEYVSYTCPFWNGICVLDVPANWNIKKGCE